MDFKFNFVITFEELLWIVIVGGFLIYVGIAVLIDKIKTKRKEKKKNEL